MLKVLIASSRIQWRNNAQELLSRHKGIKAVATDVCGEWRALKDSDFNVIVVEALGEGPTLAEAVISLKERWPAARFVGVLDAARSSEAAYARHAGVQVFLDESVQPEQLLSAVLAASRGDLYISCTVLNRMTEIAVGEKNSPRWYEQLSQREAQVLALVAQGMSNRAIARALYISEKTVKNHIYSIFRKLGVRDRTQAALLAVKSSIASLNNESLGPGHHDDRARLG